MRLFKMNQFSVILWLFLFSLQEISALPSGNPLKKEREQVKDEIDFANVPGEPLNPSEFELKYYLTEPSWLDEDKRKHGSEIYSKEVFKRAYSPELKNGLISAHYKWPKYGQYVIIPYVISSRFEQKKRLIILKAFEDFQDHTCIRFVPRVTQKDYINIVYGDGCESDAGRVGGEQKLSLGHDCDWVDIAIHELNHAVGFWHEQNRPDRDSYIQIFLENVKPENRFNFDKMSFSTIETFGQKYDTDSIMHYDKWAFSKSYGKLEVMQPKIPNENMGLAKVLSKIDIVKINLMYKCPKRDEYKERNFIAEKYSLRSKTDCLNLHSNCTEFVTFKQSECEINIWMKVNCRKACGQCDNICKDIHPNCPSWSENGACADHHEYMDLYCPKSCFKC